MGRCAARLPLPLASEAVGDRGAAARAAMAAPIRRRLLAECARVLVPGGRLWLFALNPLAPYRWRWSGSGLRGCEPVSWRRRLRAAGLAPEAGLAGRRAALAHRRQPPALQHGAGLRAALPAARGEARDRR